MASVQELETKVAVLSDMITWLMQGQCKIAIKSDLVMPDGTAAPPKIVECSMLDAYRLSQQQEK